MCTCCLISLTKTSHWCGSETSAHTKYQVNLKAEMISFYALSAVTWSNLPSGWTLTTLKPAWSTYVFSTELLHNYVTITSSGVPTSGETYNLICTVEANVPPTVQWLYSSNGTAVTNGNGITVETQRTTNSTTTLTLSFNPLHTSHGGQYTCQSTTDTPSSTVNATTDVTVQGECVHIYMWCTIYAIA